MIDKEWSSTKLEIFDKSVEMFALHGYESISVRDIGDAVGIQPSSIYNHFDGKMKILVEAYNYFCNHTFDLRLTPEQYEIILKNGSKMDIMEIFNYNYSEDILMRMINILKIVLTRAYIDENAKKLYSEVLVEEGLTYVKNVLNRGIELGRIAPMEVDRFAMICVSFRLYIIGGAVIDTDTKKWKNIENQFFASLSDLIKLTDEI